MLATPPLVAMTNEEPAALPRLAFARTPMWEQAETSTQQAFSALVGRLGDRVAEPEFPVAMSEIIALHGTVMDVDMARNLRREYEDARDQLSQRLRQLIERGHAHLAIAYRRALDQVEPLNAALDPIFDRYDALVTPAAPGEAPLGLDATGNPVFCTMWTYLGTPAVTLPLLKGPAGMPLGVQLIGRRGEDAKLLRTAAWLVRHLGQPRLAG
jgi:Asp-tRNA(Asn)/Glu-tRNA(Gln) amidotransferase A subunit family amidase